MSSKKLAIIIVIIIGVVGIVFFAKNGVAPGTDGGKANIPLLSFNPPPVPSDQIGKHPNILLVIADDMGLDADPCHPNIGSEKPHMPNLMAICKVGVTFDNVWVNPVCSPTRATMMSGQYGFRTGVTDVDKILSPDVVSLADILTHDVPVPYANAFIGKWHMSGPDADLNAPSALGVQYFAGFMAGGVRNYFDYPMIEQGVKTRGTQYTTTAFTDKAISWIQGQKSKDPNRPWFMWLAYNAPHAPFHMPPRELINDKTLSGTDEDIKNNPRKYYFAALEALDREMGRLLTSISPEVLANTTIIFVGDNGTPKEVIQAPYSAEKAKASVYEWGVWGVLAVTGKGVTRSDVHDPALINATDLYATIADLAGSNQTQVSDSTSFRQALSWAYNERNFLYTEWVPAKGPKRDMWALRDAQYKLIDNNGTQELYDLLADPYENNNLMKSALSVDLQEVLKRLGSYEKTLREKPMY